MQPSELLFIQPLLGPDDAWAGFLVDLPTEYRPSPAQLKRLIGHPLLGDFDKRQPWFIPALPEAGGEAAHDERLIHIFALPADHPTPDEALDAFAARLRQAGAKLAVRIQPDEKLPPTGAWHHLLIGASHARALPPYTLLGMSSRTAILLTGVHSHADHHWAQANACSLITGEFLQARHPPGKKADTTRVKLLELLALIAEDASTDALEAVFRQEAKLSYSLLRLVNSAAIAPRTPITCFAQAINLLGRRQLQRWLQLLVYADPNNGQQPNPLLLKAATRGRLLELLAPGIAALAGEEIGDTAFMTGVFSLLDTLLSISMSEILQQLPLPDLVHKALAEHSGPLGELLRAISAAEGGDLKFASEQLARLGISGDQLLDSQMAALAWAAKIRPTAA
jgi:EAL and modified HD-GYP domain-containing signal transduction protein